MKKKFLLRLRAFFIVLPVFVFPVLLFAQNEVVFYNSGAYIKNTAIIVSEGGMNLNAGSNITGQFVNNGRVYVRTAFGPPFNTWRGNLFITNQGTVHCNGKFFIEQDFVNNNGHFFGDSGTVFMDNACYLCRDVDYHVQRISGTTVTTFHNLVISNTGTLLGVEMDIDAKTADNGILNITNLELNTLDKQFTVLNPNPASLDRTTGFVSGTIESEGRLIRRTNSTSAYLFPLGSNQNSFRYRPVVINPLDTTVNLYGGRLDNDNADYHGMPTQANVGSDLASGFNPHFYHLVTRDSGSALADITVNYIPSVDGDYMGMSFFENQKKLWRSVGTTTDGSATGFTTRTRPRWGFTRAEDRYFILNNLDAAIDTIPNLITANGDGFNDFFHIQSANVKEMNVKIYNRWGVLLFDFTAPQIDWDGRTLAGAEVPNGTYFYILNCTLLTDEKVNRRGFFSLVR